ncbi:heme-binding protein [Paracoccus alcaliphilus]|nr:heme-binding protein [Paracoccus alcaliphilus]WCR18614.1 heme-binding protein [Paracoccus alcaliphilus]
MTARLAGYLEGEAVGGIGISSGTSAQDRDVAEAAIAAWAAV